MNITERFFTLIGYIVIFALLVLFIKEMWLFVIPFGATILISKWLAKEPIAEPITNKIRTLWNK